MQIVSNFSPIIIFARTDNLSVLREVVGSIIVPSAVYREITEGGTFEDIERIKKNDWIKIYTTDISKEAEKLSKSLGLGEREAIVLARRLSLPLLVDDLRARKEAKKQGIKVIGSLGIIYVAKRRGLIRSAKEILDSFISSGYYISNTLYSTFLEEIGEKEP